MKNKDKIIIKGARHHNLKNINLEIPKNKLVVITGVSGSGKSSLAFDTIFAEGQRRYVESLSTYARQYLKQMEKPDVDLIEGLAPAISISQRNSSPSPRSTVGTITEIFDYLRLLFSRLGKPRCPDHNSELTINTIANIVDEIMVKNSLQRILICFPIKNNELKNEKNIFDNIRRDGFVRARVNEKIYQLDDEIPSNPVKSVDVVVDRLTCRPENRQRIVDSLEIAEKHGDGLIRILTPDGNLISDYSTIFICAKCAYSPPQLSPKLFSFNNPLGACAKCNGIGKTLSFDPSKIVGIPDLSLSAGAIEGWDRRNEFYFRLLRNLADHYEFDIDCVFSDLPAEIKRVILYGSGQEKIKFSYINSKGKLNFEVKTFEGIIPNFEKKLKETSSSAIKEKLSAFQTNITCNECNGSRLRKEARCVFIEGLSLPEICRLPLKESLHFFNKLSPVEVNFEIGGHIISEIRKRLLFLVNIGLDYLTLDRSASSISGGEHQRIRLASQIGSGLTGVIYILDEPSVGLHERDNRRLIQTLKELRDTGNSVIVVEHDIQMIKESDYVIDIGPEAGENGGRVVASGTATHLSKNASSLTGRYLALTSQIELTKSLIIPDWHRVLRILKASGNNLKEISLDIPLGLFVCVTGVSGSGKSTLVNQTLYRYLTLYLNKKNIDQVPCEKIEGIENIDKVIAINQKPIGRTPRSNPASYIGLLGPIRDLFANTREARQRGYKSSRFSFNIKGGRCEGCKGAGLIKMEMHFLPDIHITCDTCKGKRFNKETLEIRYKGKNIHEILKMSVDSANNFFQSIPEIQTRLSALKEVGLDYLEIGHSATSLSGGEAQRIKMATELARKSTGKTLYILDEPTTGLHLEDVKKLLHVLRKLQRRGNSVLVVEHNLEVIKTADWIIDMGPEGGQRGGLIVASGSPEQVANKDPATLTGKYLKQYFKKRARPN